MRGVGCPCIHCLKVVSLIVSPPPRRNSPAAPRLASTPKYCWPTSWAKPVATCMPGRISRYRMHNSNAILNSSRAAPPASPSPTSPASANSGRCRWSSIATRSFHAPIPSAWSNSRWHVIATDHSRDALAVARHNAQRLQLRNIEFRAGDGVAPLHGERLDLICSNPPYVAAGDPHLDSGDLPAAPRSALEAGPTGLEVLTAIGRDAPAALRSGGWLLLEHGNDHGAAVHCLLTSLDYRAVATHRDHAVNDRVTLGRRD